MNATDSREANKALVLRFMHAAQGGDADTAAQCLAEDVEFVFPRPGMEGMPHGANGRETMIGFLKGSLPYKRGTLVSEVENIVAEGDMVCVQFRMNALTARGEDYENYYVQLFSIRDGLIAKSWEYLDTLYGARKLMPDKL